MACGASKAVRAASAQSGAIGLLFALFCALAEAGPVTTQGTWYGSNGWDGTLRGRDAAGNAVNLLNAQGTAPNSELRYVYDSVLNLTWLADWAAGAGNIHDDGDSNSDGAMTWPSAMAWANSIPDLGGGWMLPGILDIGDDGMNSLNHVWYQGTDFGQNVYGGEVGRRVAPLAHMFHDTLGNLSALDFAGNIRPVFGVTNTGPFSAMQAWSYWTGTAFIGNPADFAWVFITAGGEQLVAPQTAQLLAVAVRPGDVLTASVPEPSEFLLLGLAFAVMTRTQRRRALPC
jgi:hypothetical protein